MYRNRGLLLLLLTALLAACQPAPPPLVGSPVTVTVWKDTLGAITALELHPNGRLLAAGTATGTVRVWDTQTGQIATSFGAHQNVAALAYNLEGTYLATSSTDGALRLWDTANNRLLVEPPLFMGSINAISWLKDSTQRLLLSSDGDFQVQLIDMNAKGAVIKTFKGHSAAITAAVFIPNTRFFASGSLDRNVIIWDIRQGSQLAVLTQDAPVTSVQPSPDGSTLAIGTESGLIRLYTVSPFAKPPNPPGNAFGAKGSAGVLKVAWNSDGSRLAASFTDNTVRVYEPATGLQVGLMVGHSAAPISLIWQGKDRVISGDRDGYIRTWEVGGLKAPPVKPTATPISAS